MHSMIAGRLLRPITWLLILALLLPTALPAAVFAQEPAPQAPPPTEAQPPEPLVDFPNGEGVEPAVVAETDQAPSTLVSSGVSTFAAPSPGVYWLTESLCASPPPNVASVEDAQFLNGDVAPADADAATPFRLRRTNYAGTESRTLQERIDNSGGQPWQCPNHYKVNSNVVADQNHVYWVDGNGLVRVPVTANAGDAPQVVSGTWKVNNRVNLKIVGTRLFATLNNSQGIAWSSLEMLDLQSGVFHRLRIHYTVQNFSAPDYDGTYVYFKQGTTLKRINLDGTDEATIDSGVGVYSTQARNTFFCVIGQACPHYLFYVKSSGSPSVSVIYRRNFTDGTTASIQTRSERTIHSLLATTMPSDGLLLPPSRIFWIESIYVPDGDGSFTGTHTFSLQRAALSGGATISNLYNVAYGNLSPAIVDNLASNGQFMLWRENGMVKRLPNNAAALPMVNMRVTGMEVTQGIQDDGNTVRLVRGRETWVRVFVQSDGASVPNVTMRLTSSGGGGAIYPNGNPYMTVRSSPNRNTLTDSFLFLLPSSWWERDSQSFTAVLNPHQLPFEPTYADNSFTSPTLAFSDASTMNLVLYTTEYSFPSGPNQTSLYGKPPVAEHISRIQRSYPLAEGGLSVTVRNINGGNDLGMRVAQLSPDCILMSADSRSLCAANWLMSRIFMTNIFPDFIIPANTYHYGLISDALAFPRGRVLEVGFPLGAGPASVTNDFGYYTAHEVAHMLGRNHPTPNGDDGSTKAVEGCGHSRSDNAFPYAMARIGNGDGSIRGFDRATPNGGTTTRTILDDVNAFDVMSYCGNAQLRWPSPYSWEGLYQWLRSGSAQAAAQSAPASGQGGVEVVALFGALVEENLSVLAVQRSANGTPLGTSIGSPYTLQLLDASNSPLGTHTFAINADDDGGNFALVVPWVDGTRTLQILGAGSPVLWSQTVSSNAPVVSTVTLPGAPNPVDGEITLSWGASDADGDALTYAVHYSSDGGTTWQPVLFDLTATTAQIDTTNLPGGTGRFRVVASDGVNGGYSESANVTVVKKAPTIQIMTPGENDIFSYGQTVGFTAVAIDLQDGMLDGGDLVWRNQHGVLGTGANLAVNTLPTGENQITVQATNSAGLSAGASVTIFVGDELQGPPATLVATPTAINLQVDTGTTMTQTHTLQLGYAGAHGSIAWSATVNVSWLTISASSGSGVPAAITVSALPDGLSADMAHIGVITFVTTTGQTLLVPVTLAIGNSNLVAPAWGANGSQFLPVVVR